MVSAGRRSSANSGSKRVGAASAGLSTAVIVPTPEEQAATSSAERTPTPPRQIEVAVAESGRYQIDDAAVGEISVDGLAAALKKAAGSQVDPVVVINADARAAHQSVVNVMEAARRAGLTRITFVTQTAP